MEKERNRSNNSFIFKILTINHLNLLFFHKLEMIQCFQVKLSFKFNYFILLWVPKTKVNS
jgi:hypothetical protein